MRAHSGPAHIADRSSTSRGVQSGVREPAVSALRRARPASGWVLARPTRITRTGSGPSPPSTAAGMPTAWAAPVTSDAGQAAACRESAAHAPPAADSTISGQAGADSTATRSPGPARPVAELVVMGPSVTEPAATAPPATRAPTTAGTAATSSGRARLTASQPSAARSSRQLPFADIGPRRCQPCSWARPASTCGRSSVTRAPPAALSSPIISASSSARPSTGTAGASGGPSGHPVRCISPERAQASTSQPASGPSGRPGPGLPGSSARRCSHSASTSSWQRASNWVTRSVLMVRGRSRRPGPSAARSAPGPAVPSAPGTRRASGRSGAAG